MSDDLAALVKASAASFKMVAPKWFSVERLTHLMLSAASRQPALLECTKESFLGFCMKCAETGLEPIGAGGAWAVPFKNKYTGKKEVTFIPDWRGLISLAKRTEQIKHAYGEVVCENDFIEYEKGDTPRLVHKPALSKRGKVIGAYMVAVLPDDSKHIEYMNTEELNKIKARSKAKDEGAWVTDEAQMFIKTVCKRGLKPFANSPQLQTAIQYDNDALGLALPADRPPVAMPQEIVPTAPTPPTPPTQPTEPTAPTPPTTPTPPTPPINRAKKDGFAETTTTDGEILVTGKIVRVKGETGDKRMAVLMPGELWIGVFDKGDQAKIAEAFSTGADVEIAYRINGKYLNASKEGIKVLSDAAEPAEPARTDGQGQEELPYNK